jgi:hypothetical protein
MCTWAAIFSSPSKTQEMAAFSTFLRFLKWKMDGKWKMENGKRIHHPCELLGSRGEVAKRSFRGSLSSSRPIQRFPQADFWTAPLRVYLGHDSWLATSVGPPWWNRCLASLGIYQLFRDRDPISAGETATPFVATTSSRNRCARLETSAWVAVAIFNFSG